MLLLLLLLRVVVLAARAAALPLLLVLLVGERDLLVHWCASACCRCRQQWPDRRCHMQQLPLLALQWCGSGRAHAGAAGLASVRLHRRR
jgi:hypothetical protein